MTPERRQLIEDALGGSASSFVEIDEGYSFEVAIVDDEWVFRFPRWPDAEAALRAEIGLLPVIAPALPVKVPSFELVSDDPPFVGYPVIRGTPLVAEDGGGVRGFLDALHAVDTARVEIERPEWIAAYREQCRTFERDVFPVLDRDLRGSALRLFDEAGMLAGFEPAIVHADLLPEHLLVRDGRLVGVIDWGDARIGDPAIDYAWLLNRPFPTWDVDPELRRRARFYHRLGPWYEAHYGLFLDRPAHVRRGLDGIRARLLRPD